MSGTTHTVGDFVIRDFDQVRDMHAVKRIWHECGWHRDADETYLEDFFSSGPSLVATLDDVPECAVLSTAGTMRYQDDDVPLSAIQSVNTSHVARRRGLGKACTATALANAAASGAAVAALGIFDAGYYEMLGFGHANYEHLLGFDPADLKDVGSFRIPQRLSKDDWRAMTTALQTRWLGHGGIVLQAPELVKAEAGWEKHGFGMGYYDDHGELTHFYFGRLEDADGPLRIAAIAYQNGDQLLELLAQLRSLGDQISCVMMVEPPHVQLQDLLRRPFRSRRTSKGTASENHHHSSSFWQMRIVDLPKCIADTHLYGPEVEFNLVLSDPVAEYLPPGIDWRGVGGEYTMCLGEDSTVEPGSTAGLPTLRASVNAFSRLWLGVRPATQLTISDDLDGPADLLESLDDILRLPPAAWGWYF